MSSRESAEQPEGQRMARRAPNEWEGTEYPRKLQITQKALRGEEGMRQLSSWSPRCRAPSDQKDTEWLERR